MVGSVQCKRLSALFTKLGTNTERPLPLLTMEQEMVFISKPMVQQMLLQLHRAETFCQRARSTPYWDSGIDVAYAEPTDFYPGASGYAGATMRDVIQTLESHL